MEEVKVSGRLDVVLLSNGHVDCSFSGDNPNASSALLERLATDILPKLLAQSYVPPQNTSGLGVEMAPAGFDLRKLNLSI